jgi:hypothetical protein
MRMERPPADTHSPAWHSVNVVPNSRQPKIHFYNKLDPIWWLENADEPVPPNWYLPDDQHRVLKWHFRNPFHNFNFYVIGVADKKLSAAAFILNGIPIRTAGGILRSRGAGWRPCRSFRMNAKGSIFISAGANTAHSESK